MYPETDSVTSFLTAPKIAKVGTKVCNRDHRACVDDQTAVGGKTIQTSQGQTSESCSAECTSK